ncbi:hypothetical protein MFMK1_000716 [Metallumcola ferriviriculae]|uniref:Uncharacterized protein n=1 Tax=Metallumcola ferriviriculae TaxID=3039180 RepID=A0AAU0UL09_9FIRM|nr:hypothetical protein MFMK1_000716 [Desulfitibacteraceae bacterium MK1]
MNATSKYVFWTDSKTTYQRWLAPPAKINVASVVKIAISLAIRNTPFTVHLYSPANGCRNTAPLMGISAPLTNPVKQTVGPNF